MTPLVTAREAAAYCSLSYSYVSKLLVAYGRGKHRKPKVGIDIMEAKPKKVGRRWFFLRAALDRVLGD